MVNLASSMCKIISLSARRRVFLFTITRLSDFMDMIWEFSRKIGCKRERIRESMSTAAAFTWGTSCEFGIRLRANGITRYSCEWLRPGTNGKWYFRAKCRASDTKRIRSRHVKMFEAGFKGYVTGRIKRSAWYLSNTFNAMKAVRLM